MTLEACGVVKDDVASTGGFGAGPGLEKSSSLNTVAEAERDMLSLLLLMLVMCLISEDRNVECFDQKRWKSDIQGLTDEASEYTQCISEVYDVVNSKVFQRKCQIRRILFMKPQIDQMKQKNTTGNGIARTRWYQKETIISSQKV
jgi:hypothetical protein